MTMLRFTTDDLPPADRLPCWYDVAVKAHVRSYIRSAEEADFHASLRTVGLDETRISEMTFAPLQSTRTAKLIRQNDPERYQINFMLQGDGGVAVGDHRSVFGPAQFIVVDTYRPWDGWRACRNGRPRMLVVDFPRKASRLSTNSIDDLVAIPFDAGTGLGAVLLSHLRQVLRRADTYTGADRATLAQITLDLVTATFAHHLNAEAALAPLTRRQALLAQIYHFIDHHLADPALSPDTIAAAQRISVRYLHKLFEDEEVTVVAWIRQQRLQRCRRDLADPGLAGRSVHAIAARSGFTDRAHFNRIFRAAYGVTPGEYRRTSHGTG